MNADDDENELELTVETQVTDKTTLGTTVGDQNSSMGVFWRIPIANKHKQKKEEQDEKKPQQSD